MKTINVAFEDAEAKALEQKKGELSWHDFILKSAKVEVPA